MVKSALITGGAKRIGKDLALSLAENGWDIGLHYKNSLAEAESNCKSIEKLGSVCKIYYADLENCQDAVKMIKKVLVDFPKLDLMVHNASVFEKSPFSTVDEEVFDRQFNVNFKSPFFSFIIRWHMNRYKIS